MKLVILANSVLKEELTAQGKQENISIEWISNSSSFAQHPGADAYIDLLFDATKERINLLKPLLPAIVIVNAVNNTLEELPAGFIRINGWSTFLKRPIIEASNNDETIRNKVQTIIGAFNKQIEWVADIPGFISARVVAMIINEAYFALDEAISSREEIDLAMKSGTNYPFGPFEWSQKIGVKNIVTLLRTLTKQQPRYQPSLLLEKEIDL